MSAEELLQEYHNYRKEKDITKALETTDHMAELLKDKSKPNLCANHILEFYLFEYYFKTRDYAACRYPIHKMYYDIAKILIEQKEYTSAANILKKAQEWNPLDLDILWSITECHKVLGQLDNLLSATNELHKFIYTRADIAHYYRNIAYYYVEKYKPEIAMKLYTYSNLFSHSKTADSEIAYLEQALQTNCPEYTLDELRQTVRELNLPEGIAEQTLTILYCAGKLELEGGDKPAAEECFQLLYEVTGDEEIRKILEKM